MYCTFWRGVRLLSLHAGLSLWPWGVHQSLAPASLASLIHVQYSFLLWDELLYLHWAGYIVSIDASTVYSTQWPTACEVHCLLDDYIIFIKDPGGWGLLNILSLVLPYDIRRAACLRYNSVRVRYFIDFWLIFIDFLVNFQVFDNLRGNFLALKNNFKNISINEIAIFWTHIYINNFNFNFPWNFSGFIHKKCDFQQESRKNELPI